MSDQEDTRAAESHAHASAFDRFVCRQSPPRRLDSLDAILAVGLFGGLVCVYFLPILGRNLIFGAPYCDIAVAWWWQRGYLAGVLHDWDRAFINPFIMSGSPMLASNQTAMFYPPNWLFLWLPRDVLLNAQIVLHYWLGMAAMYWLAVRVGLSRAGASIGSLVFGFSGFALLHGWQGHLVFVEEWPFTPLAVLAWMAIQRGSGWRGRMPGVLALSAVLALQFFAGHPQIVYLTLLILAGLQTGWIVWCLWRRFVGGESTQRIALHGTLWLAAAGILAGLISAIQALPTATLAAVTLRFAQHSTGFLKGGACGPADVLTMIAPWVFGGQGEYQNRFLGLWSSYWEVGTFVTVTGAMLAVAAVGAWRRLTPFQRTVAVIVLVSWWLSLGSHGGLYSVAFRVVPGMSLFQSPGRFGYLVTFGVALLAGGGLDHLVRSSAGGWREVRRPLLWLLLALFGIVAIVSVMSYPGITEAIVLNRMENALPPAPPITQGRIADASAEFRQAVASACVRGAGILILLGLLGVARVRRAVPVMLIAVVLFEILEFGLPYRVAYRPIWHRWPTPLREEVLSAGPLYRMASARSRVDLLQGMEDGIRHLWGFDPVVTARYAMALGRSQGYTHAAVPQWLYTMTPTPLLESLGARYLVGLKGHPPPGNRWRLIWKMEDWTFYENPFAVPRARVVGGARVVTLDEALVAVNSEDHRPSTTVILEETLPPGISLPDDSGTTVPGVIERIVTDAPERFECEVRMKSPGIFVLMDQYLPGWEAWVDGKKAPIYHADAVGRALPLESGRHRVEMRYSAPGFREGLIISCAGSLLWVGGGIALILRRRRNGRS